MRVSKNFILQEFVSEDLFEMSGKNSIWFIDKRIIDLAQFARDRFGVSVTINDWYINGSYVDSGFRDPHSDVGVMFSQHKFGRAIDIKVDSVSAQEVRLDIKLNEALWMSKGLTTYERNTLSWVHLDCRNTGLSKLKVVTPL